MMILSEHPTIYLKLNWQERSRYTRAQATGITGLELVNCRIQQSAQLLKPFRNLKVPSEIIVLFDFSGGVHILDQDRTLICKLGITIEK